MQQVIHVLQAATIDAADSEDKLEDETTREASEEQEGTDQRRGWLRRGKTHRKEQINAGKGIYSVFYTLNWCLKILALDAVADIRRYKLPLKRENVSAMGVLTEAEVRVVLRKRAEFSSDIIEKIKLITC